jgi:PAS domain S-box-containing protein
LNPVAERLTGWPASEAVGRAKTEVIRLIDELTRRERPDLVPICIAQGKEMSQAPNAVMVSRYGRECPIENTLAPIRDAHGEVLGVVIVFHDISARRAAASDRQEREHRLSLATAELERLAGHFARARQIAEEASRAKRRFLAGMSHELRTPLNGILGYAQLLRMDGGLTEVQSERLQAMLSSGTHLLEMISCVLDLSEMESESAELQVAPVDLAGLADASLNIVRPTAQAKSLALDLTIARNVPRRVMTDPARLRQILLNLLGNAVKYTPQGGVALRIGIVPSGSAYAGAGLRLEVTDTGPGIPPGQRHRLFVEFDRLDAEAAGDLEGAGLGLPLTRRLAALLGGQLGYAENPGGGSVFWVEIPLAVEAGSAPPPARAADFVELGLPAPVAATGSSILVVDDVAMNRDIAAAFLRSAAYEVMCAEGGAEAVAAASAEDFLVILMDVRMPEVDGLEATRRIRALCGQRGQVPIVALTAQVFAEQVEACREAGMDTHLAKPFTLETLLGAIARGVAAARERVPYTPQSRLGAENATVDFSSGALGENLPILDETMFDRTSAVLDPEAVQGYLTSLAGRMQALRQRLGLRDGSPAASAALVEAAHALAGSAGMFGFDRLVFVARHVERAVKMDDAQATRLAGDLDMALSASLAILHRRTMLVAEPA